MKASPVLAALREPKLLGSAKSVGLHKILVVTDFSALSEPALHAAATIASHWPGVALCLVHVVPPPHRGSARSCKEWKIEEVADRVGHAEQQLGAIRSRYEAVLPFETRALVGNPGRTICDLCATGEFDLIILSSHGATGFSKMHLGSVAQTIVAEAGVSVLVLKPGVNAHGELSPINLHINHVVFGYDPRTGGRRAFAAAKEIAKRCDAGLTLVQALRPLDPPDAPSEADVAAATARLKKVCALHEPESKRWGVHVAIGNSWDVLVEAAKATGSDLIVLGPHEPSRWGHAFVGSTAEQVIALAPCAVLALK